MSHLEIKMQKERQINRRLMMKKDTEIENALNKQKQIIKEVEELRNIDLS